MSKARQHVIAAFVSVGIIGPIALLLLDRMPPYEFVHVDIEPDQVIQGGDIVVNYTIKRLRQHNCGPATVYREFQEVTSGKMHRFAPVQRDAAPVIVDNKFPRDISLSESVSPGLTIHRSTSCYYCNPLHWLFELPVCTKPTETKFEILEKRP